jgi:very-short-patch-repair endonuclease
MKKNKRKRKHLKPSYQKKLRFYQNCLKKYPTVAEIRFRYALCKYFGINFEFDFRNGKNLPWREQRQFHFPKQNKGYIVDFYLPKYKIVFEVDGSSHEGRENYDKKRDKLLRSRKIKVFRIKNEQTVDIDFTCEFIRDAIQSGDVVHKKKSRKKGCYRREVKQKKRVVINLSRDEELRLQEEYIAKHGVTKYKAVI